MNKKIQIRKGTVKRLLSYITKNYKKQFICVFICIIFSSIAQVAGSLFLQILIGMLAFITEENQSFYLIISKAMLLLIFTPLEFFPQVVQTILRFLPTTYIIYAPGKILVDFDVNMALTLVASQVISFLFVYICVYALNRKGVKNINVNGG